MKALLFLAASLPAWGLGAGGFHPAGRRFPGHSSPTSWRGRGPDNPIDRAALEELMVRSAMRRFYPQP